MKAKTDITCEQIRAALDYDKESGNLVWRNGHCRTKRGGERAGWVNSLGYVTIKFGRSRYQAHRLVWLHVTGQWPDRDLDHMNGVKTDNRIENLREATDALNMENMRTAHVGSASKMLGVCPKSKGRSGYRAQIQVRGRQVFLGHFGTADEAHSAYVSAKRRLHEGCTI